MKNQKGSTLLESLIALIIFSFGALGSMSFQANMIAKSNVNSIRLEATMYMSSLIGAIEASNVDYSCYKENQDCATQYFITWLQQLKTIKGAKNIQFKSEVVNEVLKLSITWGEGSHKVTSLVKRISYIPEKQ